MKCFVGIELPEHVREALAAIVGAAGSGPFKPQPRDQLHITLAFVGEIDRASLPGLVEVLGDALNDQVASEIEIAGSGAFVRTGQSTDVVYAGVRHDSRLVDVREASRLAVHRWRGHDGSPPALPFNPHISLWTVDSGADAVRASLVASVARQGTFGAFSVDQVTVFARDDKRYEPFAHVTVGG